MNIVDVPASHAEAVRLLAREVFDDMPPYHGDPYDYEWLLPDGERIVKGVYAGPRLIGFCTTDTIDEFLDLSHVRDSPVGTCYVSALALQPLARNKGVGTALLDRAIRDAKGPGYRYASGHFREGPSAAAARRVLTGTVMDTPVRGHIGSWETYHYLLGRLS
jgi:GNAT superfamily N-acetyltransferase